MPLNTFQLLVPDAATATRVQGLGQSVTVALSRTFADAETQYAAPAAFRPRAAVAVVAGSPFNLLQLAQLAASARLAGAGEVWAFIPYLPFMRQDKPESITPHTPSAAPAFGVLGQQLAACVTGVFTYMPHSAAGLALWPASLPVIELPSLPQLAHAVQQTLALDAVTIVASDAGSSARAQAFAALLGPDIPLAHLAKNRTYPNEVATMQLTHGTLTGRHALLVDDMIDTAGTLVAAAAVCRAAGATQVSAVAVHGVFSGPAPARLAAANFANIWCLDTGAGHQYKSLNITLVTL